VKSYLTVAKVRYDCTLKKQTSLLSTPTHMSLQETMTANAIIGL